MPSTVLTSVTASAPAAAAARGDLDQPVGVGAQLRPPRPAARRPSPRPPRPCAAGSWAKRCRPPSRFGHDRFTSTATTCRGAAARSVARPSVLLDGAAPDATPPPCAPVASSAGSSSRSQASTPGPWQADAVDHPRRRLVHPRRRVAGPRLGRQRLHHHRPERRQVEVRDPARRRGRRCPTRIITGLGSSTDPTGVDRSTSAGVDRCAGDDQRLIGRRSARRRGTPAAAGPTSSWRAVSAMPLAAASAAAAVVSSGTWWRPAAARM